MDGSFYTYLSQGAPLTPESIVLGFEHITKANLSHSDIQQLVFNNLHGHKPLVVLDDDDERMEFFLQDADGKKLSIEETRALTAESLRNLLSFKIDIPTDKIRLHVLGKRLIDQKRVVGQLNRPDETIFFSYGYVEVPLRKWLKDY